MRSYDKEVHYGCRELPYGKFSRTLTLPEGVDANKVKADYKNGVLEITVLLPLGCHAKMVLNTRIPMELVQNAVL